MSVIYGNPITLGGGSKPKKLLSSLTEGSLISVLEDGKLTPFYVAKHNYEADLNGEGRTLLVRKDAYGTIAWNSTNVNTYANSTVDTWLNGDYKELLSSTVKSQIGATQFKYTVGNGNNGVTTLTKSVFLLSLSEFGKTDSYANTEGSALPIASSLQVAYLDGSAVVQLTRSPYTQGSTVVYCLMGDGTVNSIECSDSRRCSRPCFTLPDTMALNTEPYADGSWGLADEYDGNIASPTKKPGVDYVAGFGGLDKETVSAIAHAISNNPNINRKTSVVYYSDGGVHRKISTGDTIGLEIDGINHLFNVVGFNHDTLVSADAYGATTATSKAGITTQIETLYPTAYQMNPSATNSGGYDSSAMHTTQLPAIIAKMSSDVRGIIKPVIKLASAGGKSTTIEAIPCTSFLLSEVEVSGNNANSAAGEGEQYAYYAAGNSPLKTLGSNDHWWERSPNVTSTAIFCCVNNQGVASGGVNANYSIGLAFAVCF